MKKRIAIFIYSLGKGGAEKVATTLANNLVNSFEIYVVLLNNQVVYSLHPDIKIKTVKQNPFAYKKFCKENNIHTSISMLTRPNFISIVSKLLGNRTQVIVSEHTNTLLWYSKKIQRLISFLYPNADKVVCVSKKIEYNLNSVLNIKNTQVIYNPIDVPKILNDTDEYKNDIDFISIGTLYDVKNHELLIRSFSELKDKTKNLYILGEGKLKGFLENLITELNLQDRVFLLGFQVNPYKFLKRAKVFVLSSNNEGLPNVIIEALSCGCAVISTDCVSGPREILAPNTDFNKQLEEMIEYSEYGILIPVGNKKVLIEAMTEIINNDVLRARYVEKALTRAHDFEVQLSVEQYKDLINA